MRDTAKGGRSTQYRMHTAAAAAYTSKQQQRRTHVPASPRRRQHWRRCRLGKGPYINRLPKSKSKRATRAEPIHKPARERGRNERSPLFCMSNIMYYVDRTHQISKSISEPSHASESLPQCSLSPCVNANIHLTRVQPSPTTPTCLISRFPPAASVSHQRLSPAPLTSSSSSSKATNPV